MLVGRRLGPFAIDKEIGSGAMGTVYRARNTETGENVAIKVMAPGLGTNKLALDRFKREVAILKQLNHPGITHYLTSGRFQGNSFFYAMEYVEGESLDKVMARRGRISWEELIPLGEQLCDALQHAHQHGIIHRDLKPSNLIVLPDGTLKLTDFGIAKDRDDTALTATNSTVGTAAYMSPEQCRGSREVTHKSDLYSLGIMFYELVTGRKPFVAENVMDMFVLHTSAQPERPSRLTLDIPVWLDTLICQLLEKEPDKRPFDAHAVSTALDSIRERVQAQRSAGLERAKQRNVDRGTTEQRLDETDKEVARTLLRKKTKKKKKAEPFFRKAWFQAVVISAILLGLGGVFYMVFFQAPSAEQLYAAAKQAVPSADSLPSIDTRALEEVRQGPIQKFLELYPNDSKAPEVRKWADDLDLAVLDRQMHKRRNANWQADPGPEEQARGALTLEELGNLDQAANTWKGMLALKDSKDPEQRPWGLVADKYLAELEKVNDLQKGLQLRVQREITFQKEEQPDSPLDSLALEAVRAERDEKMDDARKAWRELKRTAKDNAAGRTFLLLAAKRERELTTPDAKESD